MKRDLGGTGRLMEAQANGGRGRGMEVQASGGRGSGIKSRAERAAVTSSKWQRWLPHF